MPLSNHLKNVTIHFDEIDTKWIPAFEQEKSFSFAGAKLWLKNVLIRLIISNQNVTGELDTEIHCMLLGGLCAFVLDEMSIVER